MVIPGTDIREPYEQYPILVLDRAKIQGSSDMGSGEHPIVEDDER
jgi:hypothetical protein